MKKPEIDALIHRARPLAPKAAGVGRRRRVVVRMDGAEVARVDALLGDFPGSSRASLVRAFIDHGLGMAEEYVRATKQDARPKEGAS
jgi:hypothetical protein